MKRLFRLLLAILLAAGMAACGTASPYDRYCAAYAELKTSGGFDLEEEIIYTDLEQKTGTVEILYQVRGSGAELALTGDITIPDQAEVGKGRLYYQDGWLSMDNLTDPESSYRRRCDSEEAWEVILDGTLLFPEQVLAAQQASWTWQGTKLSFTLYRNSYYELLYPDSYQESGSLYADDPQYVVYLDRQGQISRTVFYYAMLDYRDSSASWSEEYRLHFTLLKQE